MKVLFLNSSKHLKLPSFKIFSAIAETIQVDELDYESNKDSVDFRNYNLVFFNIPDKTLLSRIKAGTAENKPTTILVTDLPVHIYAGETNNVDTGLIDHVISPSTEIETCIDLIRTTIIKVFERDFFGIEKYLKQNTMVKDIQIQKPDRREVINEAVQEFAKKYRIGSYKAKLIYGISEELLMNAIFDAPSSAGKPDLRVKDKEYLATAQDLEIEDTALRYGCDGEVFAISITDPYGGFEKEIFFRYVKKIIARHNSEDLIDTKKSGAGLGIFKILYSSHGVIVNVNPKKRTEVIALIYINQPIKNFDRMNRTIQYFVAN